MKYLFSKLNIVFKENLVINIACVNYDDKIITELLKTYMIFTQDVMDNPIEYRNYLNPQFFELINSFDILNIVKDKKDLRSEAEVLEKKIDFLIDEYKNSVKDIFIWDMEFNKIWNCVRLFVTRNFDNFELSKIINFLGENEIYDDQGNYIEQKKENFLQITAVLIYLLACVMQWALRQETVTPLNFALLDEKINDINTKLLVIHKRFNESMNNENI